MTGLRHHFLLRDDVHFLNHGSFGACPGPVFDEYQRLQRELESEPVDFLDLRRSLPGRLAEARAALAAFLGADIYTGNCHKWMLAPKGAAFLFVRRERQDLVEPLVVSWGWESDDPGPSRFVDEQEWTGTRDPSAPLAVPAALDFLRRNDWPSVREECRALLRESRARLLDLTGLEPLCPAEPWLVQMATLALPDCDPGALCLRLREAHGVEIPVFEFAGLPWLRISIQAYNTPADVDALIAGLRTELSI